MRTGQELLSLQLLAVAGSLREETMQVRCHEAFECGGY